jgi:hypothetical protein
MTIHKFTGILDERYSNDEIDERILYEERLINVKDRLQKVARIFIDKIPMISQIEHVPRKGRGNSFPFGGAQIILSGDFNQLTPVPNVRYDDPGEIVITYEHFRDLIPHHFILSKVFRQSEGMACI